MMYLFVIEDAEQRLDRNGLTIDCIRRLSADRRGWRWEKGAGYISAKSTSNLICMKYVYNFLNYALSWRSATTFNGESFKTTFEGPRQKLLTLLCFLRRNTLVAVLSVLFSFESIPSDLN